ncbi:MAG: hypothetical protein K1X44_00075 [Alphaproteobacteria bacterium]|nr:hypothetical protein [Alphaproteobacteria bacterium]
MLKCLETQETMVYTYSGLFQELEKKANYINPNLMKQNSWPKNVHNLTRELKRLAPSLRFLNIEIEWTRTKKHRLISIKQESPPRIETYSSVSVDHSHSTSL